MRRGGILGKADIPGHAVHEALHFKGLVPITDITDLCIFCDSFYVGSLSAPPALVP